MRTKFIIILTLLLLLLLLDLGLGYMKIELGEIWEQGSFSSTIFFKFRLPKALTALLSGAALAVSGLLMQTIFRNPLAGPYTLGVSSGASLGVALFLMGAPIAGLGFFRDLGVAMSAWLGAGAILLLVMIVSARLKQIMAVLILGMMFGSATSALVGLLQYFSPESALKGFVIWSMGSVDGLSNMQLGLLTLCTAVGLVISVWAIKPLNLLLLGENYARSMGINIGQTRLVVFGATSLLAGGVTAFCGPIAFVGIAAPHLSRMIFCRADHRILLPATAILGAAMLLLSDIIAHLPTSETVLPLSSITSLLGIPVVIFVVFNARNNK